MVSLQYAENAKTERSRIFARLSLRVSGPQVLWRQDDRVLD